MPLLPGPLILSPEHGVLHHLSYAGPDERIRRKIATWGHHHEVLPGWYERVWLGWDSDKLMRNQPTGGLIAVIGDDNDDFIFVGRSRDFVAQRDGVLFLGVNEGNLSDNSGLFEIVIEAETANPR